MSSKVLSRRVGGLRGHRLATKDGRMPEQYFVVDSIAPGVFDPKKGHVIHHVDGNRLNNSPSNLVVCESEAYHNLLHTRTRAIAECGNKNHRKCYICKQYDSLLNLDVQLKNGKYFSYRHLRCIVKYNYDHVIENRRHPLIPEWMKILLQEDGNE